MNIVKFELKRAIYSKKFFIAIVLGILAQVAGALIMIAPAIKQLIEEQLSPSDVDIILNSWFSKVKLWYYSTNVSCFSIPLLCCIPFSGSLIHDKKTKFINFINNRCSYKKYIKGKIIACFTSGFLCTFIATFIFYILICCFKQIDTNPTDAVGMLADLRNSNPDMYILIYTFIVSIMGGIYAIIGLAISSISKSEVAGILAPAVYHYVFARVFSFLGLEFMDPGIVNCYFVMVNTTWIDIILNLTILLVISIYILYKKENKRGCYD